MLFDEENNMINDKYSLFIVILSYKVPLEKIDACRSSHLDFLDNCYAKNLVIQEKPGKVIKEKSKPTTLYTHEISR